VSEPASILPATRPSDQFGPLSEREQAEAAAAALAFRHPFRPGELAASPLLAASWLWHGYLGAGKLTLLTSQWKSGKTTLVSILLARMARGGRLAGLPVSAGRALVVSEEGRTDWDRRCRTLKLGHHVGFFCRPFATRPTMPQWLGMIDALEERHAREGLALLVIDPLSLFLPGSSESSAVQTIEGLLPLRVLLAAGVSVLALHHPRKGRTQPGQAARGSGTLASQADIVLEMARLTDDETDRRRRLRGYSRYDDTPRDLVLELSADGKDYRAVEGLVEPELADSWQVVRLILESFPLALRLRELLAYWPDEFRKPDKGTLARVLLRGVTQGVLTRTGTGFKNDPYRYQLAGRR
jgi:hypothetical protein